MKDVGARRVAVVGAGFSGIAAAKCLLDAGITPMVFEASGAIGGVWRFDEAQPDGGSPAYRGLRTNTPQHATAFADKPFPDGTPAYPSRATVVKYLNDYANRFGVREHICFNASVIHVTPAGDHWTVRVATAAGEWSEHFDAVFVCSGIFRDPIMPNYPGLDAFAGAVLHSRAYVDPAPFAGKRVLVVGTGSSGADIAIETSQVAQRVLLSGRSVDWQQALQPAAPLPGWQRVRDRVVPPRLRARLWRRLVLAWRGRLPEWGDLRPAPDAVFAPRAASLVIKPELRDQLAAGAIVPKPGIDRIEPCAVRFVDGTVEPIDALVFATGYALAFPFLDPALSPVTPDGLDLYRVIAHPDCRNLFFIGICRATGAIPPLAEMQARWATGVLQGRVGLPSSDQMHGAIRTRRALVTQRQDDPFRLQFEPYVDLLGWELGCQSHPWQTLRRRTPWRSTAVAYVHRQQS
jgi:dimethylaniline monooxygenase (N-oxide forming)